MHWPTSFTSVHNYLDELFGQSNATDLEVSQAKKWYWRCYNTDLKRRRKKRYTNLSVYFTHDQIIQIKAAAKKGRVSDYVRDIVLFHLEGGNSISKTLDTSLIEQQLFLLVEYIRELVESRKDITQNQMQRLESLNHSLLQIMEKLYDNQE